MGYLDPSNFAKLSPSELAILSLYIIWLHLHKTRTSIIPIFNWNLEVWIVIRISLNIYWVCLDSSIFAKLSPSELAILSLEIIWLHLLKTRASIIPTYNWNLEVWIVMRISLNIYWGCLDSSIFAKLSPSELAILSLEIIWLHLLITRASIIPTYRVNCWIAIVAELR